MPSDSMTADQPVVPSMNLAGAVADCVDIEEIKIVECRTATLILDPLEEGHEIQLRSEIAVTTKVKGSTIDVFPKFTVTGRAKNADSSAEDLLRVECKYRVRYQLKPDHNFTPQHFESFGQLNGVYNAWPYWREFVQSATVRMGLPALTLAVFRLPGGEPTSPASTTAPKAS